MDDPVGFRADVERTPESLAALASAIDGGTFWPVVDGPRRLLLLGMGASPSAAEVCARLLRAAGIDAVAELASTATTWPASSDLTAIAISAGGTSPETLAAIEPHLGTSRVIALTNQVDSE